MKKYLIPFLCCILFILFLGNPSIVILGASQGLLLWYRTVLPNLFPFFVLVNLVITTGAVHLITPVLAPICQYVFGVSAPSALAIIGGFLCGYPMGATIISDLCEQHLISKTEGHYLLSFCNNASPMFIVGYFLTQKLKRPDLILPSVFILFFAPICSSFLFRRFYFKTGTVPSERVYQHSESCKKNFMELLDQAIWKGMETIIKIGGYIIVFSIIVELLRPLSAHGNIWNYFLIPSLEITNGLSLFSNVNLTFEIKYLLMMTHLSFGGFCAMFQTGCVLRSIPFHLKIYILEKLVTATITSLLCYIYLFVFAKFCF